MKAFLIVLFLLLSFSGVSVSETSSLEESYKSRINVFVRSGLIKEVQDCKNKQTDECKKLANQIERFFKDESGKIYPSAKDGAKAYCKGKVSELDEHLAAMHLSNTMCDHEHMTDYGSAFVAYSLISDVSALASEQARPSKFNFFIAEVAGFALDRPQLETFLNKLTDERDFAAEFTNYFVSKKNQARNAFEKELSSVDYSKFMKGYVQAVVDSEAWEKRKQAASNSEERAEFIRADLRLVGAIKEYLGDKEVRGFLKNIASQVSADDVLAYHVVSELSQAYEETGIEFLGKGRLAETILDRSKKLDFTTLSKSGDRNPASEAQKKLEVACLIFLGDGNLAKSREAINLQYKLKRPGSRTSSGKVSCLAKAYAAEQSDSLEIIIKESVLYPENESSRQSWNLIYSAAESRPAFKKWMDSFADKATKLSSIREQKRVAMQQFGKDKDKDAYDKKIAELEQERLNLPGEKEHKFITIRNAKGEDITDYFEMKSSAGNTVSN